MSSDLAEDGWRQVRAGISLIHWSRLAQFNDAALSFVAAAEPEFEFGPQSHRAVHEEFGRTICWITFSAGGEYLVKGVCLLTGVLLPQPLKVVRHPQWDEDTEIWSALVDSNDAKASVDDIGLGTLGKAPIGKIHALGSASAHVSAAVKYLASTIRNRDAHRYVPDVRAGHFLSVQRVFVPAFNRLLRCLNNDELRRRLKADKWST